MFIMEILGIIYPMDMEEWTFIMIREGLITSREILLTELNMERESSFLINNYRYMAFG